MSFYLQSSERHAEPPADFVTIEKYRERMREQFGCTTLPPIRYKGELIPARHL